MKTFQANEFSVVLTHSGEFFLQKSVTQATVNFKPSVNNMSAISVLE